ncbi:MAG: ATP-binding protein, partial [Myxococcota bacterium]
NDAARKSLPEVGSIDGLSKEEPKLAQALMALRPGPPTLHRSSRGATRWLLTARALRTPRGESVIISMQDVNNAMMRTEFDAWRDLIRVVNHEIINALTPISSLAQSSLTLAQRLDPDDDAASQLRDVTGALQERARSLREFIHNYRDMSRLPKARLEPVQLDALIRSLVFELDQREGASFVLGEGPGEPVWASLDASLVQQAVLNLLINAADAHREASQEAPVEVRIGCTDDDVIVEVRDRGEGVPVHAAEQLFMPFFTTKAEGNGIGLSLVRQVCLAHRGAVQWENQPEGGALFRLLFPRGENAHPQG